MTKTTSELQFETFLDENKLPFERVAEEQTPRPDYLVEIGDAKVLFEATEISEDENFTMEPLKVGSRTLVDHIRSKINEASRQVLAHRSIGWSVFRIGRHGSGTMTGMARTNPLGLSL